MCISIGWAEKASETAVRRTAQRHNLTVDEVRALHAAGCGVCGTTEKLDIDHDHSCCAGSYSCGECVRGTLCRTHNMALGKLGDNLDGVMRLVRYLED